MVIFGRVYLLEKSLVSWTLPSLKYKNTKSRMMFKATLQGSKVKRIRPYHRDVIGDLACVSSPYRLIVFGLL